MPKFETESDLIALHIGNVKEGIHLEYKASDAIDKKSDAKKIEMARDVSAFANADGGQIVYGMTEVDHEPAGLDTGLDPKEYPEIWFEQVLQQHVTPKLIGLRLHHVALHSGRVAVVIDVPATKSDPHQVSDGRYYRRHNFNRLTMEHYEVQAAFRRTTTPEPFITLAVGYSSQLSLTHRAQMFTLRGMLGNRSSEPALYTIVSIGIDRTLELVSQGDWENLSHRKVKDVEYTFLRRHFAVPGDFPVFKEAPQPMGHDITLKLPPGDTRSFGEFYFRVGIQTPGFRSDELWYLQAQGLMLKLQGPVPE